MVRFLRHKSALALIACSAQNVLLGFAHAAPPNLVVLSRLTATVMSATSISRMAHPRRSGSAHSDMRSLFLPGKQLLYTVYIQIYNRRGSRGAWRARAPLDRMKLAPFCILYSLCILCYILFNVNIKLYIAGADLGGGGSGHIGHIKVRACIMNNIRVYSVLYILYYVQCVYL